ncbi:hypothetical protein SAMN06265365_11779 [Tistlia consotensis]|uniref:Novel STAND NTPase 1 domain-containing protein n=1 Tax=Tistlia consotensis USBA 355 TaxID=560819 RepID=A0A1Y6CER7_9PROT|nr:hypothetical protein [Tistlia consotensis]SMF51491.1 hypothetical protein SAMN05428998_11840 [Tistlia consotensis USBA 355]SNR84192.1 hypothetical protein SAMN06265365_11779 [Tistlia consotensis]
MPSAEALSASRPFPGLRPYRFHDRAYFCGREEQSYALFNLIDTSQFVAVVGSSGSGKSSLVRAGLLPLLEQETEETEARERQGGASSGRRWRWIQFRPGDAPLSRLAEQLAEVGGAVTEDPIERAARREELDATLRRSSYGFGEAVSAIDSMAGCSLLIVVDQFEELFRYGVAGPARMRLQEERDQFVQLLLTATGGRDLDLHVLITMRSDFIGDCSQFYGLPEAVSECQFLVPALTRLQCEEVVRRPLDEEHANAFIEPALVEQLLNDVSGELDQLPVLQHCLSRLWEVTGPSRPVPPHRELRLEHYRQVGGIAGALSNHADEILADLAGHEIAVEQVFRALSEEDNEGRATRRALTFAQLRDETGADDAELRLVVDRFRSDDCSFLVPSISAQPQLNDATTVDIGHEALLRRWQKIGAEASDTLDEDARAGWLQAEASDAHDYRMMLRLAGNDPDATLPLNRVGRLLVRWEERPRTAAWAERYGGHIERVERLFDNTLASRRRRWWSGAAVVSLIALLAIGGLLKAYLDYTRQAELAADARQERTAALGRITEITQAVSIELRFIPGTNRTIYEMLESIQHFSDEFRAMLKNHYPEGLDTGEIIVQEILSNRAALMRANYLTNFGNISEAIDLLVETKAKIDEMPKAEGREPLEVQLLRGDVLLSRASAEVIYGRFDVARQDYAAAEEIYRTIVRLQESSAGAQSASAAEVTSAGTREHEDLEYIEKARQKLAALYQGRIFLNVQYDENEKEAASDLAAYKKLVEEERAAHPSPDSDENSKFWARQTAPLDRLEADVLVARNEFDKAIEKYEGLLDDRNTIPNVSRELYHAFLEYKLSLALLGRARNDDVAEAIRLLDRAKGTFGGLTETDPKNMWWLLVSNWIDYALGRACEVQLDRDCAEEAYKAAKDIDAKFLENDPDNLRASKDLARDEQALTALGRGE